MINDDVEKLIQKAGERARKEAKSKGLYVVYEDEEGNIVREYPDGTIVKEERK